MDPQEKLYRFGLSLVKGVGIKNFIHIVDEFSSIEAMWKVSLDELIRRLGQKLATLVYYGRYDIDIKKEEAKLKKKGIEYLVYGEETYPKTLKEIFDPPMAIFYKGDIKLFSLNLFSVVGTRRASDLGRHLTGYFSKSLSDQGFGIVSGMAFGIDAAAHRAVLEVGGKTIAVLGSPIDRPMPFSNYKLFEKVVKDGLVISEYPIGSEINSAGFPRRNRIISGLSVGTLVVEAPKKSGALITAHSAIEQNREVFAIPWSPNVQNGHGCNNLIKGGKAKLVENIQDIVEEFGYKNFEGGVDNKVIIDKSRVNNSELEIKVLSVIGLAPVNTDKVAENLNIPINQISACLLELELKGQIFLDIDGLWKILIK